MGFPLCRAAAPILGMLYCQIDISQIDIRKYGKTHPLKALPAAPTGLALAFQAHSRMITIGALHISNRQAKASPSRQETMFVGTLPSPFFLVNVPWPRPAQLRQSLPAILNIAPGSRRKTHGS